MIATHHGVRVKLKAKGATEAKQAAGGVMGRAATARFGLAKGEGLVRIASSVVAVIASTGFHSRLSSRVLR